MEEFGPVQIMVVGFDDPNFTGEILAELRRLREAELVRVVDLVVVAKDENDDIAAVEMSDLTDDERTSFGAIAGALVGLGMEGDEEGLEAGALAGAEAAQEGFLGEEAVWSVADAIPPGSTAAVALLEHRWAIPLRDAIRRAGGVPLADSWIHPEDLVALGAALGSD
jgi:uncharacterized membrane protein